MRLVVTVVEHRSAYLQANLNWAKRVISASLHQHIGALRLRLGVPPSHIVRHLYHRQWQQRYD